MLKTILFSMSLFVSYNTFAASPRITCDVPSKEKTSVRCDAYIDTEISDPADYTELAKKLTAAKEGDEFYIHLIGPGGNGDSLVYIINNLETSKARTISVVEGPVASAHAVLAVATDRLTVRGPALFLFHNISGSNMTDDLCTQAQGKDRGLPVYEKCKENMPKFEKYYNIFIAKYVSHVLTADEQKLYNEGHDIILNSDVVVNRLKNGLW